ncbi:MAG: hypothetical protein E7320_06255 [Clostridiales bacterium]|nr:hypothetical protein [Clostridiales bacterium]
MDQPYSKTVTLDAAVCDMSGRWQPGAILRTMQEVSGEHAEGWGLGREALTNAGIAWVLSRSALKMDRYPQYGDAVTIHTWPGATRHAFFPRHYTFELDGEIIGCATALYVLLDIGERKMAHPSRLPGELPVYDIPAPMPTPGVIALPEAEPLCTDRPVRYTDLDFNGHVNNTRYVDWYVDCFDWQYHTGHELAHLTVHYLQEIRPGEAAALQLRRDGDTAVLQGFVEEQPRFQMKGIWRERTAE